ncbi:MAG: methionine--tRNA ligase [Candidatus Yanofskybacteria bacterium RIFCSPHIGHO2_02_FULL_43_15c]|uniref:Methionine--tRNA ligase n=1 Tax=Candidatus Yanofskybacteria bacterium RIFCSPHIGHO2_02_FULL_43_15c TaxID=1802679 RepID=A0A1F8FFB6_9BACT|nr:MAG: methionine--tRNA ligase [Candidatus Yanofskybacteria bacterium RIFCSPHIGHO2_02_FULL_43_15c]
MLEKYFITTAIPYVNGYPHLGHALEFVQTDVLARYNRLRGREVFFLTGTDENALKNVQSAEKAGEDVKTFIDRHADVFRKLTEVLNLSNDDFIRTTEERHILGAQKLWKACEERGDIYKKKYQGLYCVGCESFKTEKELIDGLCPEHKVEPEKVEEENYFFRLSGYEKEILRMIESDELKILPSSRKNELTSFIKEGLEDFSISRSRERVKNWGIPVPGDDSQILFVWFDALSNYINALGYGGDESKFQEWWENNPNKEHLIGKGITRFHAIYWPAVLISAKLKLPSQILVHGYLTIDGEKISKSLGNVIDPFKVVEKYGVDPVRYFLLREISSGEDGDFSEKKLEQRYQADLANGLGNLVQRVLTLIENNLGGEINYLKRFEKSEVKEFIKNTEEKYRRNIEEFRLHEALGNVFELIGFANAYTNEHRPWDLAKENPDHFLEVMINLTLLVTAVSFWIYPFLPETAEKILESFGLTLQDKIEELDHKKLVIKKGEVLFPRLS